MTSIASTQEKLRQQAKAALPGKTIIAFNFLEFTMAERRVPTCRERDDI